MSEIFIFVLYVVVACILYLGLRTLKQKHERFYKPAVVLLLVLALIFSATGHLSRGIQLAGLSRIEEANEKYLEESYEKARDTFLVLTGIKAGLAIIKGSSVEATFIVGTSKTVGDVVKPVYKAINVVWRTCLAAAVTLLFMRLLLPIVQDVGQWLLFGSFIFALILCCFQWKYPAHEKTKVLIQKVCLLIVSLSIALILILPISIRGASNLSRILTGERREEAFEELKNMRAEFTTQALLERMTMEEELEEENAVENEEAWHQRLRNRLSPRDQFEKLQVWMSSFSNWLVEKTGELFQISIILIIGYLFDIIIFPLTFFIVLYFGTKLLFLGLLGSRNNQDIFKDFKVMLEKYYGIKE